MWKYIYSFLTFCLLTVPAKPMGLVEALKEISRVSSQGAEISEPDVYLLLDSMESGFAGVPLLAGAVLELRIHDPGVKEILLKEFGENRVMASKAVIAGLLMQTGRMPEAANYLATLLLSPDRIARMMGITGFGLAGSAGFCLRSEFSQVLEKADQFDANQCYYIFKFLGRRGCRYESYLLNATALAIRRNQLDIAGLYLSSFANFPERSKATLELLAQVISEKAYPEEFRFAAARSLAFSSRNYSKEVSAALENVTFTSPEIEGERKAILREIQRNRTMQIGFDLPGLVEEITGKNN